MGKIRVTLHRWAQDLPDAEITVDQVGGRAPEEITYRGAVYHVIPGAPGTPTYALDRYVTTKESHG